MPHVQIKDRIAHKRCPEAVFHAVNQSESTIFNYLRGKHPFRFSPIYLHTVAVYFTYPSFISQSDMAEEEC